MVAEAEDTHCSIRGRDSRASMVEVGSDCPSTTSILPPRAWHLPPSIHPASSGSGPNNERRLRSMGAVMVLRAISPVSFIGPPPNRPRESPLWVDGVDKVHGIPPTRNNRIGTSNLLNQCCVFELCFESMLLGKPSKIVFQQHRSEADIACWSRQVRSAPDIGYCSARVTRQVSARSKRGRALRGHNANATRARNDAQLGPSPFEARLRRAPQGDGERSVIEERPEFAPGLTLRSA